MSFESDMAEIKFVNPAHEDEDSADDTGRDTSPAPPKKAQKAQAKGRRRPSVRPMDAEMAFDAEKDIEGDAESTFELNPRKSTEPPIAQKGLVDGSANGSDGGEEDADMAVAMFATRGQKPAVLPECEEDESKLVSIEEAEDLFEHISEALTNFHGTHNPSKLQSLFKDVDDMKAQLTTEALGKSLEEHLRIKLGPGELQQLHAITKSRLWFGSGNTSLAQFMLWWENQCGINESADPFQVALAQLAESNMISPNSSFRGNWWAVVHFHHHQQHPVQILSARVSCSSLPCLALSLGPQGPGAGRAADVHCGAPALPHRVQRQRPALVVLLLPGPLH